ncbi:MAG: chromosome partitioning protein ParA [Clostridiales bacterium GWF2_38_85]|nr:MAG: chromosome partitioning protein ParA [Clostridiales bacterium GWF2_38_85]
MEEDNCRVFACVNQKGGVGKSVTSTNLGIGLARHGKKVLVVDLDSQASQTVSLGWTQPDELPVTIATQLGKVVENKPIDPQDGILHHAEGVDLMPSSIELSGLEMRMVNAMSREFALRTYLSEIKPNYDVVVLDCPPTLGMMTINALAAADRVIVPVQPEYLSVIGMTQLFDSVALVKKQINPTLKVDGVLITLANMRTNLAKNTLEILHQAYGGSVRIFPHPIPYSTKIKEASASGKSIFAYDPKGSAAYAYEQLVKEVERDGRQIGADVRTSKKVELSR